MNENNENAAPAPVEEWEPLAVIRRLFDLYRSNKSDTEVSARAMAMIQEFGARLSRSTPPAERPTPITFKFDANPTPLAMVWNDGRIDINGTREEIVAKMEQAPECAALGHLFVRIIDLERQLAEAREKIERQGEVTATASLDPMMERALTAEKRLGEALALAESNGKLAHDTAIELREVREQRDLWEKRAIQYSAEREHNAMVAKMMEAQRDNAISDWKQADTDSIRAIHERNEAREQRDQLAAQFTKLDKPKYSGEPMMDKVLSTRNPEFDAWVQSLPPTYWTRYDLSAARIGWEAALAAVKETTIAGFHIIADPTLPPGTGKVIDPKTGETLVTIKES